MARLIRLGLTWVVLLALLAAAYFYGRDYIRRHPQDVPWTPLDLDDPIGLFTLRKLASLADDPAMCRALLNEARSQDVRAPDREVSLDCGYADAMRLAPARGETAFAPANVVASCPMAASLLVLERQVLQPAATRHFGSRVREVSHAGSYSCRRLYGRSEGGFSEHATANAFDVLGFRLEDGTSISVLRDWETGGPKSAFLTDVRNGACELFATTLSPDYNAAHADHLHFDHAGRGKSGFSLCR